MRMKLLVGTQDNKYGDHFSNMVSEHYSDAIDVCLCLTKERMNEMLEMQRFDAALLDADWAGGADLTLIHLPILLWTDEDDEKGTQCELRKLRKYQRVSSMVANILEQYAKVSAGGRGADSEKAQITAVWSPGGGVGKTTVALAYATRRLSEGKQVLYLNLEPFSSAPVYFSEIGKSISLVFEMLENREGNVKTLIRGIRRQDNGDGLAYFCKPDNFDDMNILSAENVSALITACAGVTDELVIDMSCVCDERARRVFELADRVLLVTDPTNTSQVKLSQFTSQHNVFSRIRAKSVLIANKGASPDGQFTDAVICFPLVQSADAHAVYTTLSNNSFECR